MKKHIIEIGHKTVIIYQDGKIFFTRHSVIFFSLKDIVKAIRKDYAYEQESLERYAEMQEQRIFNCN